MTPYLPYDLKVVHGEAGYEIYEPTDRSITGQLTLATFLDGKLSFTDLQVPSNGRFNQEDLRRLWDAGAEVSSWQARTALARADGTFGRPEVVGTTRLFHDWRSLELCAHDAAALLQQWPTRLERRVTWVPVGVPGGVEDVPLTTQEAPERGFVSSQDDEIQFSQSARWVGTPHQLRSAGVAAMALAVIRAVRAAVPESELPLVRGLINPIAAVSAVAAAPIGHRDPEPSSWPIAFATFVSSCLRAIADLQSASRGHGVVPLLDTDELYEAWLAVEARSALDEHLGSRVSSPPGAIAAWERDDIKYALLMKPSISRGGSLIGRDRYVAVVAELLTPDLVLAAVRDDVTAVHVLDAKSWNSLTPEQALEQSAKYLYGIRSDGARGQVPAITGVDLVTCAPAPTLAHLDVAAVRVLTATPTQSTTLLGDRVAEISDLLAAEIVARERTASEY